VKVLILGVGIFADYPTTTIYVSFSFIEYIMKLGIIDICFGC